jgi:hypothetical protein
LLAIFGFWGHSLVNLSSVKPTTKPEN